MSVFAGPSTNLSNVVQRVSDPIDPQSYTGIAFYIGLENIESHSGRLTGETATLYEEIKSTKVAFLPGDILYGKLRPNLNKVHLAVQAGICSTDILVLRPLNGIFGLFYSEYFRTKAFNLEVLKGVSGQQLPRTSWGNISLIKVPAPNENVVATIVAECQTVDFEVIQAMEKISSAKMAINEQVKLCFSHHPLKQLNQIADLSRGASPRPIDDFWTEAADGVPWIKIGDVATGAKYIEVTAQKITLAGAEKSKRVRPGDFIISNSMSVGRPYILAIEGCVHDGWLVLANIIDAVDKDYLYYALSSDSAQSQFQAQALGGVVKNLNIDRAKGVTIAVPPISVQLKLVKAVQAVEQTIAQAQAVIDAAPAKKQAVMQKYL